MRTSLLSTGLVIFLCTAALASGPGAPTQTVPVIAAQIQAMRINDIVRLKAARASDFTGTGITGIQPGDELELKKISPDEVLVRHLPSGQTGVVAQPK